MSRSSESSANVSECSIDIDEFTETNTVNHNKLSTSSPPPSIVTKSNKIDKYKTLASTKPNEMKNLTFSISRLLDSSSSSTTTTTNGLYGSKSKTDTDERCSPKSEDGSVSSPSETSSTTSKTLAPKCSPPSSFHIASPKTSNGNHISPSTASYLINMNNNFDHHHHHHSNNINSSTSPNNSVIRVPAQRLPPLQSQSQSHSASNTPTNTTTTAPAIPYSVSYPWMTHGTSGSPFIKDGYSSKFSFNENQLLTQSIKTTFFTWFVYYQTKIRIYLKIDK